MSYLKKQSSDSKWWLLLPGHGVLGKEPDLKDFPQIFKDQTANRTAWNVLGASLSTAAVVAAASVIANNIANRRWDKKRVEAHRNKVNALFSFSTPNVAPAKHAVTEVRSIGVSKPKLLPPPATAPADVTEKELVEKTASSDAITSVLPILATIPVAAGTYALIKDDLKDVRKEALEREIEEKRNKLDKLYAQLLKERATLAKNASVEKTADFDWWDRASEYWDGAKTVALLPLLAAPIAFGLMSHGFTSKHDNNRAKLKMLEKQIISQNLTNIPDTLEVITGEGESIPKTRKEQKYIDELNKSVEALG